MCRSDIVFWIVVVAVPFAASYLPDLLGYAE